MSLTFLFSCADAEKEKNNFTSEAVQTAEMPVTTESQVTTVAPVTTEVPVITVPHVTTQEPVPLTTAKPKAQTPTILINTEGGEPINSRDFYISATVSLEKSDGEDFKNYPAQIRGRGNSTWNNFEKKPYRLKFDF
ncbi:MAG: hypothetical protein E7587_10010, partial [Ruminococcaceae bacterium]|nr:hypothetical protein [Oscillospiraceae bacterium]